MTESRKIRYAVVGQGWFSQAAVLPAFANASQNSTLAAIVSGDPVKREELSQQYRVPAYPYEEYDQLLATGRIDAAYIALPNAFHCDYTIRTAKAGVHVLCEKPMAGNVRECEAMIAACDRHDVKLMVAYRLHFEEGNLQAIETVKSGRLGEARVFSSVYCQQVEEGNTRLDAQLASSPLMDIGIYCINAARYLFQDDPIEVVAFAGSNADPRFRQVPEIVSALMRFTNGRQASFMCGFGEAKVSVYRLVGTIGSLSMEPAYSFDADLKLSVTNNKDDTKTTTFRRRDQVGAEIVYFSDCILQNRLPEPSGLEGLADLMVIEAIEQSIATGKVVPLPPFPSKPRPSSAQEIHLSPVSQRGLVNASPPQAS